MSKVAQEFFSDARLGEPQTAKLYRSPAQWAESQDACPSAHFMRRAWERLGLEAILTVEGRPTVYFKEVVQKDLKAEAGYQRLLWNQGVATILVVRDPREVRVYSGLSLPSAEPVSGPGDTRLVELLDYVAFANNLREFICRVQTGQFYREHTSKFSSKVAVDQVLLDNLNAASKRLCSGVAGLRLPAAHALLGRLLFTCYLGDRKVIGDDYLRSVGVSQPGSIRDLLNQYPSGQAGDILFKLFRRLQSDFNGSLFGDELENEAHLAKPGQIEILKRFLNGEQLATGQLALGFPPYDFSLIPVETISAIYENFLRAERKDGQEQSGSFYTPRHLAEMAVDIAVEGWDTLLDKRCLDPACGSGIFLVILFNRMAEEWRYRNPRAQNNSRARKLRDLLTSNVYGVDLNETACRIACFSLYLAFLDQLDPRDIWELKRELDTGQRKVLPPLLALPENQFANTETPRVFAANFFDRRLDQAQPLGRLEKREALPKHFDLVIGNPPWVGRLQKRDVVMEDWLFSEANPYWAATSGSSQLRRSRFLPQKQRAHAFMWKAPTHLNPAGRACLILPSKVWLNDKTNEFQAAWLKTFAVEKILQLADYSFVLFEGADCPATVVRFLPKSKETGDELISYDVPKVGKDDPRQALLSILPEDRKTVALSEVVAAADRGLAPLVWKQSLWGTARDLEFIGRLRRMRRLGDLAGEPGAGRRWIKGQGFKPFTEASYVENPERYGEPKRRWWSDEHKFIGARNSLVDLFLVEEDAKPIGPTPNKLHRSPDKRIFQRPLVLISQGVGERFLKSAYCDFPVLFQNSLQSIAGPAEDEDLLMFLAGVLSSPLAIYFLFHTSANWGVERDKVHFFELLRLPFPLPEQTTNPNRARETVRRVADRIRQARRRVSSDLLARENEVAAAKQDIRPLVNEYYGLTGWEQILVEDTVRVFEPSSTPSSLETETDIRTLAPASESDRAAYAQLLCETINRWAHRSKVRLSASGFVANRLGLGLLRISKGETVQPYTEAEAPVAVAEAIEAIQKSLTSERRPIAYLRGFTLFEKDHVHLLKPLSLRHWTRTAALNDADELAAAFLKGQS